ELRLRQVGQLARQASATLSIEAAIAQEVEEKLLMAGGGLLVVRVGENVERVHSQSCDGEAQVRRAEGFGEKLVPGTKVAGRQGKAGLVSWRAQAVAQLLELRREGEELLPLHVVKEWRRLERLDLQRVKNLHQRHCCGLLVLPCWV